MEWYTREEAETSEEFGTIPEKRSIENLLQKGFVLIDKPFGPTSNQVSSWIRKELDIKKTGHFGTLDPNATGVLPIGLNSGTRINNIVAKTDKGYVFEAETNEEFSEDDLKNVIKGFKGENSQVPPEKSAVKQEERTRQVYEITLIETEGKKFLCSVKCEAGFYVRVLIEQIGEELGTHTEMNELRRIRQNHFTEEDTNTIQDIVDAYHYWKQEDDEEKMRDVIHPIEKAVEHLPKIVLKDSAVNAVANGADLGAGGITKFQDPIKQDEKVALVTMKGELIAIASAEMNSEELYDQDGTAATLESVHMSPSEYPKRWKQ